MKIGNIQLDNNTVLAPLAGITNLPLRLLAKEAGCGLVCSEMISANGLVYGSGKTLQMLASTAEEKPLSVQIFGSRPDLMAEAAAMVADSGADILDINFGCSVRKVLKTGSGSALMKDAAVARDVMVAVRKAVRIPLTIKIRSGWTPTGEQALDIARLAQDCGVDAVAIHPRTATQAFRGCADWSLIARVRDHVNIPVIGNGDIETPAGALKMMAETGCDAVMVGRAAMANPWIFSQIVALQQGREFPSPTLEKRFAIMLRYLQASVRHIGEAHACRMMRSRLGWFVKGLPHSSRFRESIKRVETESETADLIRSYHKILKAEVDPLPSVR
ncbi:MAG: tRNA dihydrouridine synthase DusB [Desulfobacterales bacterium]|nr:tRNA dihydrouridine synthase DusB [Desulfobacterales bacterium]